MNLKGTGLILTSLILQIISTAVLFIISGPLLGLLSLIDVALIAFAYRGYSNGEKGWATFATAYGIISIVMNLIQSIIPIGGIILLIGGIMGLTDN